VEGDNKYYHRSRISEWKFRELARCFALDLSATDAARRTNLTRKTTTVVFLKIRHRIAEECERSSPFVLGQIARDAGHLCTLCFCNKCSKGRARRAPVFALIKHEDGVFTEMAPDCRKAFLSTVIRGREGFDASGNRNGYHSFDALASLELEKPFQVQRYLTNSATDQTEVTDAEIDHFWAYVKRRLEKFHGVSNRTIYLHMKESEWRFNMRKNDSYPELLKLLRNHPI